MVEDGPEEPRIRERLAIPTWLLVGGLLVLSTLFRYLLARRDPSPWIFNDEIQYSELAKSLAYDHELAIRSLPGVAGFGFVYSTLIAPAFLLFDSTPDGWEAAKAINSLLMSLTVVPVYLLARRVAGRGYALAGAAISVAIPALMFTATIMTENAFYPLTALWMLVAVRALERPTILRQLIVFGVIAIAFYTRAQGAILVPAYVGAVGLLLVLDALSSPRARIRRLWGGLRAYWPTWALVVLGFVGLLLRQRASGGELRELLGSYGGVTQLGYEYDELPTWALYHLAELDIFLGVFPLAAFLLVVLVGLRPGAPRELRILASVGAVTVASFLAVVSAYASSPIGDRILERNFFHVAPVFCVALAAWLSGRAPRAWWAVAPAAMLAGSLTLALPLNTFLNGTIVHSTPGLLPVWRWQQRFFGFERIDEAVAVAAIAAAVVFSLLPRKLSPVVVAVLLLFFAAASRPVESFTNDASRGSFESIGHPKDWVDRAVGREAHVSMVWMGGANAFPWFVTEVFNRSIDRPYTLTGPYDGLVTTFVHVRVLGDGRLVDEQSRELRLPYVLTDSGTTLGGTRIATNGARTLALYRTTGPVVAIRRLEGLYADGWSGPQVNYRQYGCRGGSLSLSLENNPVIHPEPFQVSVLVNGVVAKDLKFTPSVRRSTASIPLTAVGGICDVSMPIPVAFAGNATLGDARQLGIRFREYRYVPPR